MPDNILKYHFTDKSGKKHTVWKSDYDADPKGFAEAYPDARFEVINRKTGDRGNVAVGDIAAAKNEGFDLFTVKHKQVPKMSPARRMAQQAFDSYVKRPKNQMGKAPAQAPKNASPFVKSLYETDNAMQGADYPIDYTSPRAIQQVHQKNQQVKMEASRTAAKQNEWNRQNQPIFDNGSKGVLKTQGQLEKEIDDTAGKFVDSNMGDYISKAVLNEQKAAMKRGAEAASNSTAMSYDFAGLLSNAQSFNKEIDPDLMGKNLTKSVQNNIQKIFSDPRYAKQIEDEAAHLGISTDGYIQSLASHLQGKLLSELDKSELKNALPKNGLENFAQRFISSNTIGKMIRAAVQTRSQNLIDEQAMAQTESGNNPYYKPSVAGNVFADVAGMATDPVFHSAAGIGGKVAGKVVGSGDKLAAIMANGNVMQRLGLNVGQAVTSGGVTGFVFGTTGSAIQNASTGEDTSLGGTLKAALHGGVAEAGSFATMGVAGVPLGMLGRSVGLKSISTTPLTKEWFKQGTKKVGLEAAKTWMEGTGMYLGGYVAGKIEGHEQPEFNIIDGTLQSLPTAIGFRVQHLIGGLGKGRVKDTEGKDLSWAKSTMLKFNEFLTSDKAKSSHYLMSEDERNQIFNSEAAKEILQNGDNIVSLGRRARNANVDYEDPYLATDMAMVKNSYDKIMADPTVSWDAKAKFSAVVMGVMPSSRPMGDHYSFTLEKIGDDKEGYKKYINEYSSTGELLSKISYDTAEQRGRILYNQAVARENNRFWNAFSALVNVEKNDYNLQNQFFREKVENWIYGDGNQERLLAGMRQYDGSTYFDEYTRYVADRSKMVEATLKSTADELGMDAKDLAKAVNKSPLKRTDVEQNACVTLRKNFEKAAYPENKAHAEQSHLEGKDLAEDNDLGTEQPNSNAVVTELNNLSQAESALQELMDSNDVFSEEYERYQSQGLTNPQIYDAMIQQSGLTEEQLEPFARYINANARVQGMQQATAEAIEQHVESMAGDWGFHGTMNGQKADGSQMLYVQDSNGRTLIVGSGDVAYDPTNGKAKEGVGDMLVCLDPNTREMAYVKAEDTTLFQTQNVEDFKNEERTRLQQINSEPYNQAAAQQATMDAAKPQEKEKDGGLKEGDTISLEDGAVTNGNQQEQPQAKDDAHYTVANSLQSKVGGSLSKDEADSLVSEMEDRPEAARDLPLTPENWKAEFGENGEVNTPLGVAKMGENQLAKMFMKGREAELGLVKPTLENPDVIIEEASNAKDGESERPSSYLFVKTFIRDGKKIKFYTSVSVKKDGMEVVVSNHFMNKNAVDKKLQEGKVLYIKGMSSSNSSDMHLAEHPKGGSDLLPTPEADIPTAGKDTNNSSNGNENNATLTFADGSPVPMVKDSKGRPTPDYANMKPEQAAEILTQQFGENAEKVVDGQIKKAEKAVKDAEKMKVDYTVEPNDILEQEQKKKAVTDAANKQLEHAQAIKKVMTQKKVAETIEKTETNESPTNFTLQNGKGREVLYKVTSHEKTKDDGTKVITFSSELTYSKGAPKGHREGEVRNLVEGTGFIKISPNDIDWRTHSAMGRPYSDENGNPKPYPKDKVTEEQIEEDKKTINTLLTPMLDEKAKPRYHVKKIIIAPDGRVFAEFAGMKGNVPLKRNPLEVEGANQASPIVKQRFDESKKIKGRKGSITLPGHKRIKGVYYYGETSGLTPSHDATDGFKQSEGFPINSDGTSANSRSYRDKKSQEFTIQVGLNFGGEALKNVPVVQDGVVLSGNGTIMGKKLAERDNKDDRYYEDLEYNAEGYGFTWEQLRDAGFKGTVYFVPDEKFPLDSRTFDIFNKKETKSEDNTEQAVAKSKTLTPDEIGSIVADIEGNGSLEAFFNNPKAISDLVKTLQNKGIIGQNEVAGLMEGEFLNNQGKDLVKNILLGAAFKPETIRMMGIDSAIKTKVVSGIRAVMDNMKLGDYSLRDEIDQAIQLLYEARTNKMTVDDLLRSSDFVNGNARDRYSQISQALAQTLENKATLFRDLMREYNEVAKSYNTNEGSLSFYEHLGKDELLKEFVEKSKIINDNNIKLYGEEGRNSEQKDGDVPTGNEERPKETGSGAGEERQAESKQQVEATSLVSDLEKEGIDIGSHLIKQTMRNVNSEGYFVGDDGSELVYHGTDHIDLKAEDLEPNHTRASGERGDFSGEGVYFTASPENDYGNGIGQKLLVCKLKLKKPFCIRGSLYLEGEKARAFSDVLKKHGYDSVINYLSFFNNLKVNEIVVLDKQCIVPTGVPDITNRLTNFVKVGEDSVIERKDGRTRIRTYLLDDTNKVVEVAEHNDNRKNTEYFEYDGKKFGGLQEVADYIDSKKEGHSAEVEATKGIINKYAEHLYLSKDDCKSLVSFVTENYGYVKDAFDIWKDAKENRHSILSSDPGYLKESREIRAKEKDFESAVERMLNDMQNGLVGSIRNKAIEAIKIALENSRAYEPVEKSEPITITTEHGGEKTFSSEEVDLAKKIIAENPEKPITQLQRKLRIGYEAATALAKELGWQEKPTFMPKTPEPSNPIEKAAEDYKKGHPMTEEEIMAVDGLDDEAKYTAIDYLNGEDDSEVARICYEQAYAKRGNHTTKSGENVPQSGENRTTSEKEDTTFTTNPMETIEKAAAGYESEKEKPKVADAPKTIAEKKAAAKKLKEESDKKTLDLMNQFLAAKDEKKDGSGKALSILFPIPSKALKWMGRNLTLTDKQKEILPKLLTAIKGSMYARIKEGIYNLEDVIENVRKDFKTFFDALDKDDVNKILAEAAYKGRFTDPETGERIKLSEAAEREKKMTPEHKKNLVGDSKTAEERKQREESFISNLKMIMGGRKVDGIRELRQLAKELGLEGVKDTDLQELAETAVVSRARDIANSKAMSPERKFAEIKKLYANQPSLNMRDSDRIRHQQYSTPAPYAYLADMYVSGNGSKEIKSALEPSAGNGMLTIGLPIDKVHVNDIDEARLTNLRRQGFKNITSQDGTQPFADKDVDVVVTNPPFGSATQKDYDGYKISSLEGQMAINALESMKDDGCAAIIIGGKTEYAKNGSLNPKDKAFLGYLYSHYNVEDVINVDGSLYAKQGTSYPTRIILINGRRKFDPEKKVYPPIEKEARAESVKDYDELYKRINDDILRSKDKSVNLLREEKRGSDRADSGRHLSDTAKENDKRNGLGNRGINEQSSGDSITSELDVQTRPVESRETSNREPVGKTGISDSSRHRGGEQTSIPQQGGRNETSNGGRTDVDRRSEPVRNSNGENGRVGGVRLQSSNVQPVAQQKEEKKQTLTTEKVSYTPSSHSVSLGAVVPARQKEALDSVLGKLGDADQYVADKLGYNDKEDLYAHLAAEQVDAVALALKQMEKGNGFIIGDQTGIGKGRQAAAIIRYAVKQGRIPVSFTIKPNLFSDTYRDLSDIGSKELRPFILASNSDGSIKENYDEEAKGINGEVIKVRKRRVIYKVPNDTEKRRVLDYIVKNGKLPEGYDYILTTYSQIQNGLQEYKGGKWKPKKSVTSTDRNGQLKRDAIEAIAGNGIFILDESHSAAGEGSGSAFIQKVLPKAKGVAFLSATYAKTPDAMKLYALKTDLGSKADKGESSDKTDSWKILNAIKKGGNVFQEIMSQSLTKSGQMIRRERDMTGVTIDWNPLTEDPVEIKSQRDKFDNIFGIFNDILNFQRTFVDSKLGDMSDELAMIQGSADHTPGTKDMGIGNVTFASKAFNVVQQALFSIKAEKVADYAIEALKNGEKPVIAVNNTMEGMTEEYPMGVPMDMPDLNTTLMKGLEGILRYTVKDDMGGHDNRVLNVKELGEEAEARYNEIKDKIANATSGLSISPIDVIKHRLEEAGYRVGELTGRQTEFVYNKDGKVVRQKRKSADKNALADQFNNGDIDVVILNRSASTGISLHASTKFKDQRQRTMIFAQMQGNINEEVQMRGRIDRTGQVRRGKYVYLVSSIPAEQRLMMMFKNKLKSLDANTTSSQKSKFNEVDVQDFTNKYGDEIALQYMAMHPEYYNKLADPLGWGYMEYAKDGLSVSDLKSGMKKDVASPAYEIMKRLTLLPVKEQEIVLNELSSIYKDKIDQLNAMGMNDLEITDMPLEAKTLKREIWKEGSEPDGDNAFADNTYIETVEINVLRKPMRAEEVVEAQSKMTNGKDFYSWKSEKIADIKRAKEDKVKETEAKMQERLDKQILKAEEATRKTLEKQNSKIQKKIDKGDVLSPGEHILSEDEMRTRINDVVEDLKKKANDKRAAALADLSVKYDMFIGPLTMFRPDRTYSIPTDWNLEDAPTSMRPEFGRIIGFKYDKSYNLSSSSVVFATADSRRRVEIPLNRVKVMDRISRDTDRFMRECNVVNMNAWDRFVPTKNRTTGRIITGNMLEALSTPEYIGHLISYTTSDGEVKQGILVPDSISTSDLTGNMPIRKAFTYLRDGAVGKELVSVDGKVKITKDDRYLYTISVPYSQKEGSKFYKNEDLLDMVSDKNFYSRGNNMIAQFRGDRLSNVIDKLNEMGIEVKKPNDFKEKDGTHFRMELGKTFSSSKEDFDGVRDRAVEENGIVMPNLNKESVKVVSIPEHGFSGETEKELREEAERWGMEHLVTKVDDTFPIMRDGTPYSISKKAIEKYVDDSAINKSNDINAHLSVLKELKNVIKESVEAEIHPDYNKNENGDRHPNMGHTNNVLIHRLYGAANINGKIFRVKTTMQEFRGANPNRPHSFEVTKVELIDSPTTEVLPNSSPLDASTSSENELSNSPGERENPDKPHSVSLDNSISVAKLLNGVEKSYDSGKKLLDESKDLTDGETSFRNVNNSSKVEAPSTPSSIVTNNVAKVSKKVGSKVNMVNSPEEVVNPAVKERLDKGENVTGWYDEKTGEVHLYMPNIHDTYTAEKTIWHETVGHKAMRGLIGDENYSTFLRNVWYDLDKPENARLKELVDEELKYNPFNYENAIEEGIARLVEDGKGEVGFWNNIRNKVADLFHSIGYHIAPNTKDVKYLLWLSKNLQKNPNNPYWKMRAEAVRYKLEHEKYTTIKNGVFADNDGKVKDYSDFTRKDWEEATDMTVHFRTTPAAATEIEIYNRAVGNVKAMAEEAYSDKMNSVLELYKAIDPSIKRAEDVKTSENPYMIENLMSSRAQQVGNAFARDFMEPMTEAYNSVLDSFAGIDMDERMRNVNLYIVKKSGLERNRALYVRDQIRKLSSSTDTKDDAKQLQSDWNDEHERLKGELDSRKINLKGYFDGLDNFIRKNIDGDYNPAKNDYSGFHEMQGMSDVEDINDAKIQDEVMSAESSIGDSRKVDDLWRTINAATEYSLDMEYKGGFIDSEMNQYVKGEMNWYVPMRMFDEKTAEDVYGYIDDYGGRTGYVGPALMKAKGRKSLSNLNILAQIGAMGERSINRAARNGIKQAFMRFVNNNEKAPAGERLVTEVKPWFEKVVVGGVETWEERYPQIPEDASPLDVSRAVANFENAMKSKEAKGEAKQGTRRGNINYKFADKAHRPQHIVDVWVNGKKKCYVINGNPRAAQAINGMLDHKGVHNWFSNTNRWLSQVCTSYNPEFTLRNTIRDYGFSTHTLLGKEGAAYTMKFEKHYAALGFAPIVNAAKGIGNGSLNDVKNALAISLFKQYKNGTLDVTKSKYHKWFKEFMDNGGETGYLQMKNVDAWKKQIETDIKNMHKGKLGKINPVKAVSGFVEDMNEMAENIARFATFCASRESGRNITRAAYDAKEVSTNFNRSGSAENVGSYKYEGMSGSAEKARNAFRFSSSYLRNYTMFFNASVQSFKGLSRNLKNAPIRTIASMVAEPVALGLMMPLINQMLYALWDDDEKDRKGVKDPYAELPEYERRNNLCIYAGKGRFVKIPIAIEGRAFYGLGDIAASYSYKKDLKESRSLPLDVANQLSQIVPVGSFMESSATSGDAKSFGVSLGTTFLPSMVSPVIELIGNRDWKGQHIYNDNTYMDNAPAWKKAYGGTSELFLWANKKANAWTNDIDQGNENMKGKTWADVMTNPFVWEQLFNSYVGGMGTFATRTGVTIKHALSKDSEVEAKDIPFIRSLLYTPSTQTSLQRTKSKWYNYKSEVEETNYNLTQLKHDSKDPIIGLKSAAARFKYLNSPKSQEVNIVNDYDGRIKKLNKVLKVITDDETRKNIEAEKDKLMQEAVEKLDKID